MLTDSGCPLQSCRAVELLQGSSCPARTSPHWETPWRNSCHWNVTRRDLCLTLGQTYQNNRCACFILSSPVSQIDGCWLQVLKITELCPVPAWHWQKKPSKGFLSPYKGLLGEQEIKFRLLSFGDVLVTVAIVALDDRSHMIYALPRSLLLLCENSLEGVGGSSSDGNGETRQIIRTGPMAAWISLVGLQWCEVGILAKLWCFCFCFCFCFFQILY